jgi:hypothetical protein
VNTPTPWIKAARSANNNDCVEMRRNGTAVEVRDSKNVTGPVLTLAPTEFGAWLAAARTGELDHLR